MTAHSKFGGSSASRWLNCPGSVVMSEGITNPGSSYAEEGSFAHALAERALLDGATVAANYLGQTVSLDIGSSKVVTKDMADAVQVYLDAVWAEYDAAPGCDIFVEEKFTLPIPAADEGEVFGSNDATVYNPVAKKLTIFDYKHGMGVIVFAYENKQLMFYAAGAVACHPEWDIESIELVIVQPRAFSSTGEGVDRWEMPLWMLIDYPDDINTAVANAKGDNPKLVAGEWCRWCPASTICTVRETSFLEAAKLDYGSVAEITAHTKLPTVEAMDAIHMSAVLEGFDHLSAWVDAIRDRVNAMLMAGEPVRGWKVVEKQARRRWADSEAEIAGYLELQYGLERNDIYPRKLVTMTEAEKQIKAALDDKTAYTAAKAELTMLYTVKESSGLTIAPESDKRPAVVPSEADFGGVDVGSLFDGE